MAKSLRKKLIPFILILSFLITISIISLVLANDSTENTASTMLPNSFNRQSPADMAVVNTAIPNISVHLSNIEDTYDINQVNMTIDGGTAFKPIVSGLTPDYTISYTPTAPLKDGNHIVSVSVYDNANPSSPATCTWSFKVEVPPVIEEKSPDYPVVTQTPIVAGYASDINSDIYGAGITIDGQLLTSKIEYIQTRSKTQKNYARISARPVISLDDGIHNVTLVVYDSAGNSSSTQWSFSIDTNTGTDYTDMPVVNDATCWKCHPDAVPIPSSKYSTTSIGGRHPEIPSVCYSCHNTAVKTSQKIKLCTYCHYDNIPSTSSPRFMSYRHSSDGYYGFTNILNVRHPINDKHLSSTTGCEKCHSRILTDEHNRPNRTDKYQNPINCDTCHTANYLGDELSTGQTFRIENPSVGTYPEKIWYAPSGQVFTKVYLDALMLYGMSYEIYIQYPGKGWGYLARVVGPSETVPTSTFAKWLDLPVPGSAVKTKFYFSYSNGSYVDGAHVDVPKVKLIPNSAEYQKIQNAINNKDTSCGACHTQIDHDNFHASGLDQNCQICHKAALTQEHLSNSTTTGRNYTCDTCHDGTDKKVARTISANSLNCAGCHKQGHNVIFVDTVPADVPLYPGFRWTTPIETSIFIGEPTTPVGYDNGQVAFSGRRTDVAAADVWDFYYQQLLAKGWTLKSGNPAANTTFVAEYVYGTRAVTVKYYNADNSNETGMPQNVSCRLEIWYK